MRLAWTALALVCACGFPKLAPLGGDDGGAGDGGGSGGTLLAAIDEPSAKIGDTITLEGDFTEGLRIGFPGGVTAPASLLGPNRATVVVPDGATTGRLSVADSGAAVSLPFRTTTFDVSLGYFDDNYHQADYARAMPQYRISYAPTMVSADAVYVFGGAVINTLAAGPVAVNTIVQARINADGTLDDFLPASDHLRTARAFAGSARVGDTTYLIGGVDDVGDYLDTVEAATLKPDGTFALSTLTNKLTTRRFDPTCAVIGNWLYVIGGKDFPTNVLNTIERAQINADGTLGAFEMVNGELQMARYGASSVVDGTTLYVAGGADKTGAQASVEQAPIMADGSLETFANTTGRLSAGRLDAYATIAGGALYVIGGQVSPDGMYTTSADAGMISADGSIATFTPRPNLLANPRGGFAAARVGNYLYAIGGSESTGITLSSIEAASITGNQIGTFGAGGSKLSTGRHGHASAVIGRWLYVIGGRDRGGARLDDIERAPIGLDGTLGAFAPFAQSLREPCSQPNVAVLDGQLYVIGGSTDADPQGTTNIEQAAIDGNGDLEPFAIVSTELESGRFGATIAVIDGYVIVFGGSEAGTDATDGEHAPAGAASLGAFDAETTAVLGDPAYGATPAVARHRYYSVFGDTNALWSSRVSISSGNLAMTSFVNDTTSVARTNASSVWMGDSLFMFGGSSSGTDGSSVISGVSNELGEIGNGLLLAGASLPVAMSGQTSTILGNHVYIVGGTGSSLQDGLFGALLQ